MISAAPPAGGNSICAQHGARTYFTLILWLVVFAELSGLDILLQAYLTPFKLRGGLLSSIGYFNLFPAYIVKGFFGFAIILLARFGNYRELILGTHQKRKVYVAIHGVLLAAIYFLLDYISGASPTDNALSGLSGLLLIAIAAAMATAMLLLAPLQFWLRFVREQRWELFAVIVCLLLYKIATIWFGQYDKIIAGILFTPTVQLAGWIDHLLGYELAVDISTTIVTVGTFSVIIAPGCLGYQGIGLILLFLGGYIYIIRAQLIFPNVLLVIPLAIVVIWLLNTLRIALLMAIGSSWSPEIAIQGFHSAAGWWNFTIVGLLSIVAIKRTGWFTNRPTTKILHLDDENRLLVPQLALIAASLATLLFTASFDWLYPVRVVIVGAILFHYRRIIRPWMIRPHPLAIGTGIIVSVIWIMMVPASAEEAQAFTHTLFSASLFAAAGWLLFRIIGAVIIVPLAEEMAFRGFLLTYCEHALARFSTPTRQICATLISSIAFGALHGSLLAGTLAGIAFAAARYFRGEMIDAIIAHMTANLLLAAYVLAFAQWSYW
ncbi:exosortase E/protease, VPEID-CTERM system [Mariprofundus ferrooxydans]|uniref:CAAX amino terminal protease family protein n=1 Tax=Mariprofundus ferrooxydans PV-1 TaxID=314345 RepID=Q0F232_9PROT|nr:exosortase E/protease, VPEID-CTERM system [Mariprofundus ferrooxydans]EAU55718.1 CAAX amino terminal protease family protein [Mariprofundus ferrooxydans PV-1]